MATVTDRTWIDDTLTGATFSECRRYRLVLWRRWMDCPVSEMVAFCGVNPSRATEQVNDNTVRRCIRFAKDWGFGGYIMLNLFAWRETDPDIMRKVPEPIGDDNDAAILWVARNCGKFIASWGGDGNHLDRDLAVLDLLKTAGIDLYNIGMTTPKPPTRPQPRHPLFVRAATQPTLWIPGKKAA